MNKRTTYANALPVRLAAAAAVAATLVHAAAFASPPAAVPAAAAAPAKARPAGGNATLDPVGAGPRCSGEAARPASMTLMMGKSNLMRLPEPVRHRAVGNAGVVQAMLVSQDTLYLLGVGVGTTNMIIQGKSGACSVVDIMVTLDMAGLQAALASAMPEEKNIKVSGANESIVLTGTVADASALVRAGELAQAFAHDASKKVDMGGAGGASAAASSEKVPAQLRVINMLSVTAPQQVMLEVKIAEVSKTLLERLEGSTSFGFNSGSWTARLAANFLSDTLRSGIHGTKTNGNRIGLDAQKQDNLVRVLAEPTVMAVSGQEGSFLAGGKIYIPVAQDNNKVTLEEKEFGVGVRFTPTVLAGGRINLRVSPEVSEVSREGIGISAVGFSGGAVLPLITTRRASTTVQLYDGQSFAIGGLIKNNLITGLKGLPLLGEVPVLGALFRSADYQQDRTELVFIATVRLVKPLPPDFTLPTDKVSVPGRAEFLLGGQLEGAQPLPPAQPAAPVVADASAAVEPAAAAPVTRTFEVK